jgi:hypothetical protein
MFVTMRSWVQVLEIVSCRNAEKGAYIGPKVVGPFPGPCTRWSYMHRAAFFYACEISENSTLNKSIDKQRITYIACCTKYWASLKSITTKTINYVQQETLIIT